MKKRNLGKTSLQVSPLCFGGNIFGWTVDESKSFQILDAFIGTGFNFIDTADVYSRWIPGHTGGESETIIGKWLQLKKNRSEVIIATKVGMEMGPDKKGLSKNYILKAVENSLQRLQTDYIDLYQSHQDDSATPLDETLAAHDQLVKQGKVRFIGASNYNAQRLTTALDVSAEHQISAYTCLQPLYNLYDRRDYETNLKPVVEKNGLGMIPYFSLAAGFLTGKYRSEADFSKSPRGGGMKKYLNEKGFKILKALDEVSQNTNSNPTRVSLAWLLNQPTVTAPIVSATSLEQLKDLEASVQLNLSHSDLEVLNQASQ